jgi:succinyl-diaminopimelate desuccinylase
MNPLIQTLATLVDTPSVTGSEGRICTLIAGRLLPLWTMQGVHRIGNSLLVGQRTGRPLITLFGHTDTVPEQGDGGSRLDGDRMYGLGTSDMKAGLAVMMHLLEDVDIRSGAYDVVGVFYDKEEGPAAENGLEDVLDRAPWLAESDLAIVMEPTDLKLELGCNGVINADVIFRGTAAHSARPWLGENAVTKAGEWLAEMHRRQPVTVGVAGLEYREVFSVTQAQGGIATNVLPDQFTLNLNYRFPPVYDVDTAVTRLHAVASAADDIVVRDKAPAGIVPEGNPHVERLRRLVGGRPTAKQGWTDVARLTSRGIPAVNYGPGEVAQAHRPGESIAVANLDVAHRTMKAFLVGDRG